MELDFYVYIYIYLAIIIPQMFSSLPLSLFLSSFFFQVALFYFKWPLFLKKKKIVIIIYILKIN